MRSRITEKSLLCSRRRYFLLLRQGLRPGSATTRRESRKYDIPGRSRSAGLGSRGDRRRRARQSCSRLHWTNCIDEPGYEFRNGADPYRLDLTCSDARRLARRGIPLFRSVGKRWTCRFDQRFRRCHTRTDPSVVGTKVVRRAHLSAGSAGF